MRSQDYKGLSLQDRFDKFFIEPKFDSEKISRLVEIVNEYIDEVPIQDLLPDLIEKHFPKGKCKERGHAIVLGAVLIIEIREMLKKEKING